MNNKYKYYGNYDKNIKAIRGGGVITPSNPPNREYTTDTIKKTWYDSVVPTPPLFETVYYSNKNLSNGYLNTNNYVIKKEPISDYYYPSQKFNKVINLKKNKKSSKLKKEKKIINELNPLEFPPPLINSCHKPNLNPKLNQKSNLNKNNLIDKSDDKIDKLKDYDELENKFLEYIINNTIYDGKYIYRIEDKPIQFNPNNKYKTIKIPYLYNEKKQSNIENLATNNNLCKLDNFNNLSENLNNNPNPNPNDKINLYLLVFFSLLLIIYFTIYQK